MTFITPGTITNANPGPALYSVIETAMLADGWTLEDTVVIGGRTHKVLKSAAAGNVQNLDWYLDINYPTTGTTGGMLFAPFESYVAASDLGVRGVRYITTTDLTIDATTYSRFGATGSALETNWIGTAATNMPAVLSASAFNYWISVTRNRIIVLLSTAPGRILFTGFYTPSAAHAANAGAAVFPLVMASLNTGVSESRGADAATTAGVTRLPKVTTMGNNGWEGCCIIPTMPSGGLVLSEGIVGVSTSPFTGRATLATLPVLLSGSGIYTAGLSGQSVGAFANVGTITDVAYGAVSSSLRGDTVADGGDTWCAASSTNGHALFFKEL